MLSANAIVDLHDRLTRQWHQPEPDLAPHFETDAAPQADSGTNQDASPAESDEATENWLAAVARQHRANFDLWHIEDEARRPGATDMKLAAIKRRVDETNQRRNNLAEDLDRILLDWLQDRDLPNPDVPLHSESPGLMIDRLSILALKIYHTGEEAGRTGEAVPEGHAGRCRDRLAILKEQRADLAHCLDIMWLETLAETRRFKLYRQLKMYNDPSLNPSIYRKLQDEPGG